MNSTAAFDQIYVSKSPYGFMHAAVEPPVVVNARKNLLPYVSDGILALIAPVVAYWTFSLFFHLIDTLCLAEKYRIHPSEEIASRNRAGRIEVLCEVIFQHIIQSAVGFAFLLFDEEPTTGFEQNAMWVLRQQIPAAVPDAVVYYLYTYGLSFVKLLVGFAIIDTWQYWLHRLMHTSTSLYRKFHSRHHRLYVPYAYGALYNAPLEGFLLDTLGTGIAMTVTGLTHREQIVLFTFATLKTVDDHCGYALPFDPFQIIFPNNAVYHDIHHQHFGIKTNFAQPFFTFWDTLFGTNFKGFEEYQKSQRRVTIDKYKQFLAERKSAKVTK
ncbi:hypothetical protein HG536_0E03250 [Torulaspora globosa]|uniref:Fatty acid hydroxylase domain-containing protein n=1 Tax=Torulaspora globosa TaxID=48254 RepID=A0A7G3ZIS8_9SACH|nr:uncharacterized protein HG536_0E03250 [Torulaspora globosa]QLL33414.1 hypothetical protein HG536_0E03250 [Torulaspora globosa]